MTRFFLRLYDFFAPRRGWLFALTAACVALLALLAARVRFDENITDIFPRTADGQNLSMIFNNLKTKDRIFVLFSAHDEGATQDDLIAACDDFARQLAASDARADIRSITASIGEEEIARTTDFIYDHLPVFLDEGDYARIDSLLAADGGGGRNAPDGAGAGSGHGVYGADGGAGPDGIDAAMQRNYRRLLSPAGLGLGAFIARDPLSLAGKTLGALQHFNPSLSYRLVDDHIFSADGTTCLMIVEPVHASSDTAGNERLVDRLDSMLSAFPRDGIDAACFGTPGIAVHNARRIKNDTCVTLTAALLLIVAVITCSFRNRWAVVLITLPVAFGGLFALGCIALTTGHISLIAVGAGAAVFGVAVSYSIHVVCHANHAASPREIVAELAYPMTVGSITTIGAFAGLMFTSSSLLSDFGLFAALALIGTTLFSLVCLPHLLRGSGDARPNRLLAVIERFNAYPFDRNRWLVALLAVLFLVGLLTCRRVGFDSDMSHLSYIPPRIAQAEQRLEELFGADKHRVTVIAAAAGVEQAVQRYTALCTALDGELAAGRIREVTSAGRFVVAPSAQREKIDRWERFWSTHDRRERLLRRIDAAGRRAGFAPGAFAGFGELLRRDYAPIDYADPDAIPLLGAWISSTDQATLVLAQIRLDDALKERVYETLRALEVVVPVDRGYFANRMARTVSDDFNYVLYMSGLLVFFALWLSYRRLELTLMTFAPMCIAFTVILGLMAVLGIDFNIVNIILSTFIFGIGDDFSIFIMDGLQREYGDGRPMLTNHKTAIFFSVLTTILGIGALSFADHPVLRSTSVISIIGMLAVILSAYTILPLLFRAFVTGPAARGGQPYTLSSLGRTAYCFLLFVGMCIAAQIVIGVLVLLPADGRRKRRWVRRAIHLGCRALLRMVALTEHRILRNDAGERFDRPAVVIANHHSFIDILLLLSLDERLVMLTNSWVWRSPVFGRIVRYAGFCCVDEGYDEVARCIARNVGEGNSVVIFPEGTRSQDGRTVGRFHKGAFSLAEELGLDIVPVLLYGTGMLCSKRQPFHIRKGDYGARILPRITAADPAFGTGYRERTKAVSRHFRAAYEAWCAELDTTANPWFRETVAGSYRYKADLAEQRARRRMRRSRDFRTLTAGIPRDASVAVFGAGQGELPFLLALLSPRRRITAFEADADAVGLALHSRLRTPNVTFVHTDYALTELPEADVCLITSLVPPQAAARIAALCRGEVRHE